MKNLDSEFTRYLTTELELGAEEIAASSADELLDSVLTYEGHGMYAGYAIRNWIKLIYHIDLGEVSGKISRREFEGI